MARTILVVDTFERADENPVAAPWARLDAPLGPLKIVSGAIGRATVSIDCAAKYLGASFQGQQWAEITLGTAFDCGVLVRCQGNVAYGYNPGDGANGHLIRFAAGVYTSIAVLGTPTWASGDRCRLEVTYVNGTTSKLEVFQNDVARGNTTDTAGPQWGGVPGVAGLNDTQSNWPLAFSAGDFGAGIFGPPQVQRPLLDPYPQLRGLLACST